MRPVENVRIKEDTLSTFTQGICKNLEDMVLNKARVCIVSVNRIINNVHVFQFEKTVVCKVSFHQLLDIRVTT